MPLAWVMVDDSILLTASGCRRPTNQYLRSAPANVAAAQRLLFSCSTRHTAVLSSSVDATMMRDSGRRAGRPSCLKHCSELKRRGPQRGREGGGDGSAMGGLRPKFGAANAMDAQRLLFSWSTQH